MGNTPSPRVLFAVFVGVFFLFAGSFRPIAQESQDDGHFQLKTVVIDAGHGGKDPGALNKWGGREKDVTLAVALKLKNYLKENSPYHLVLTRDSDTYPTLPERAEIANQYAPKETIFVSIHCNASENPASRGAETYIWNHEATDNKAKNVAARENVGADFSLSFILNDLRHRANAPYTEALAKKIQASLVTSVGAVDRKVLRGPFYVLFYPHMPSVLVEIGFISNKEEQTRLRSENHQAKIAAALGKAIVSFGSDTESWRVVNLQPESQP